MKNWYVIVFALLLIFSSCSETDDSTDDAQGINIFENTLIIDYSISNTSETEQFIFSDFCYLDEYGQMSFGGELGSYLAFFINGWETPLHVGTYTIGESEDQLNIDCYTNSGWNHFGVSGTANITYLENESTSAGEIHVTFNNVKVKRHTNDEFFVFSGTLKGKWNF